MVKFHGLCDDKGMVRTTAFFLQFFLQNFGARYLKGYIND